MRHETLIPRMARQISVCNLVLFHSERLLLQLIPTERYATSLGCQVLLTKTTVFTLLRVYRSILFSSIEQCWEKLRTSSIENNEFRAPL